MNLISKSLFFAAAITTAIPGILHLLFASNVLGSIVLILYLEKKNGTCNYVQG
jgi:hypothetical protein